MKNDIFIRFLFQKIFGMVILLILLPPPKISAHQLFNDAKESIYSASLTGMAPMDAEVDAKKGNKLLEFAVSETSILCVEYYFDTDPGVGNGKVLYSSNPPLFDASSVLDISTLTEGIHTVFFRTQDSNGIWGVSISKSFYVYISLKSDSTSVPVTELQYALDSTSNFNSIGAIVQDTSVSISTKIDITGLSDPGIHTIFFKAKDTANNSSPIVSKSFYLYHKLKSDSTSVPVTEIQYALDNASNFNLLGSIVQDTSVSISTKIDITSLSDPGIHTIFFKAKDTANNSSPIVSKSFYIYHKLKSDSTSVPVTEIQYALDSTSSFNLLGSIIQNTSVILSSKIDIANLDDPGIHTIYFKTKDAANNNSLIVSKSFYLYHKLKSDSTSVPVADIQYALDGTSNFNSIGGVVQDTLVTVTSKIDIANLNDPGLHTIYFKAKDTANNCSPIVSKSFYTYTEDHRAGFFKINRIEYSIDSIVKNGNGIPLTIRESLDVKVRANINLSEIALGIHTVYFKAKDEYDGWSYVKNAQFKVLDIENEAPIANAGADQSVNEGSLVYLDGSASRDNDNQSIIYFWTAPDGITLSDESLMNPTFIAPEVSANTNYTFSLAVNDGFADSPADEVIITVKNLKVNQDFVLNLGWNIISANVIPVNLNLKDIFQPLIDAGTLKKVMDESGKAIENFGALGGWKNNIGNLISTKGYKVNVTATSTLSLEGTPVELPLDINLATGWNIISYPCSGIQDAKALVQLLIDAGKLKKVMDEAGKAIENFGALGGWKNNIGNFLPGKGYKVNVLENCTLTISTNGTKSAVTLPELMASEHFKPVFIGNGTDHMNINLVNLQTSGLLAGDEIGVFDGKLCVGSAMIGAEQMMAGSISIPASANDELATEANGFNSGNPVILRLFRNNQEYRLSPEILNNSNSTFTKGESMFAWVNTELATSLSELAGQVSVKCYPNPFNEQITIEIQLAESQKLDVKIYDVNGKLVRNLYKGESEERKVLVWDGKNEQGAKVVPGSYLLKANEVVEKIVLKN